MIGFVGAKTPMLDTLLHMHRCWNILRPMTWQDHSRFQRSVRAFMEHPVLDLEAWFNRECTSAQVINALIEAHFIICSTPSDF
jgi:hypothetical protein